MMMMGKRENTAIYPRGYTKLQQLAEICGTWLKHWQRSSKWKMKRESLIYWMSAAELNNLFFLKYWDINIERSIQHVSISEKQHSVEHFSSTFKCPIFSGRKNDHACQIIDKLTVQQTQQLPTYKHFWIVWHVYDGAYWHLCITVILIMWWLQERVT